MRERRKYTQK